MDMIQTRAAKCVLITGATGFIGSRLALHAKDLGIQVLATGRTDLDVEIDREQELRAAGIVVENGSLQEPSLMRRLVADCDAVIHLAAAQHESQMPESYFQAVNVDVTRSLLQACLHAGIRRFVYGSSMGVYGDGGPASGRALDEDSPTRPDNAYTRSKLHAETLVRAHAHSMQTCVIRIGETYGPGDRRLLKLFRAIERGRFYMIGTGNNRRQCIHVNDLVRGLLLSAWHPDAVGETFVFAGSEVLTTNQMVQHIASALDRALPRIKLPMLPFIAAASVMERILPPLHIQPPLHQRRLDFFRRSFVFSIDKARHLLDFQPEIDFRTGVQDTIRWYRSRGLLAAPRNDASAHIQSA